MDGLDSLSLTFWTVITPWLTPTLLFLLLNLVIGTIAFTSKSQTTLPLLARLHSFPNPPSFLQRLPSVGRLRPQNQEKEEQEEEKEEEEVPQPVVERTRSDPVRKTPVTKKLRRSASEKKKKVVEEEEIKRPATVRERKDDDEEVDSKADDFINMFRNQLKLQRMNSIVRYKEMLNRGN